MGRWGGGGGGFLRDGGFDIEIGHGEGIDGDEDEEESKLKDWIPMIQSSTNLTAAKENTNIPLQRIERLVRRLSI